MATDWQFEYNSIVIGDNTDYHITEVQGLEPPDIREDEVVKAASHGSFIFGEWLDKRVVTIGGFLGSNDAADFRDKRNALVLSFSAQGDDLPLVFQGWTIAEETRLNCKPIKRNFSIDLDYSLGFTKWAVQLEAGDPRIYDNTLTETELPDMVDNIGTFTSPPVVTIEGPYDDPVLTQTETGYYVAITGSGILGDELEIDFLNRTIKKNGASVYSQLDAFSTWWELLPGENNIAYVGGGTATMAWRSAWQ